MRLIDADALIEAHYQHCNEHHGDTDIFYGWSLELMQNAPTIDAVPRKDYEELERHFVNWEPVVRCKDCFLYGECQAAIFYGDDGYCSCGERRRDE